jgi:hypothetical protein
LDGYKRLPLISSIIYPQFKSVCHNTSV